MPAALPIHLRQSIVRAKKSGKTLLQVAQNLNLPYSTVLGIWRFYKSHKNVNAHYSACGPQQYRYYRAYRFSIRLKKNYPEWGAPFILTILEKRYPNEAFPSPRTFQKWFKRHHLQKPPMVRPRPEPQFEKVLNVHDCWQIDAKENIHLKDGTKACYLTTVDVKSGIALGTPLFSHRQNQSSQAPRCTKGTDTFIPKMGNAQNYSGR